MEPVALRVLAEERGIEVEVHYEEWFELLRSRGYLVSGKGPLDTFLADQPLECRRASRSSQRSLPAGPRRIAIPTLESATEDRAERN